MFSSNDVRLVQQLVFCIALAVVLLSAVVVADQQQYPFPVVTVMEATSLNPHFAGVAGLPSSSSISIGSTETGSPPRRAVVFLSTILKGGSTCQSRQCYSGVWGAQVPIPASSMDSVQSQARLRDFAMILGDAASKVSDDCTMSVTLSADSHFRSTISNISLAAVRAGVVRELTQGTGAIRGDDAVIFAVDDNRIRRYVVRPSGSSDFSNVIAGAVVVGSMSCSSPAPVEFRNVSMFLFENQTSRLAPVLTIRSVAFSTHLQQLLFTQPFAIVQSTPSSLVTFAGNALPPQRDLRGRVADPFSGMPDASITRWDLRLVQPSSIAVVEGVGGTRSANSSTSLASDAFLFVADEALHCVFMIDLVNNNVKVVAGLWDEPHALTVTSVSDDIPCSFTPCSAFAPDAKLNSPIAVAYFMPTTTSRLARFHTRRGLFVAERGGLVWLVDLEQQTLRFVAGTSIFVHVGDTGRDIDGAGNGASFSLIQQLFCHDTTLFIATRTAIRAVELYRIPSVTQDAPSRTLTVANREPPVPPPGAQTQTVVLSPDAENRTATHQLTRTVSLPLPTPQPTTPAPTKPPQCGQPRLTLRIVDDDTLDDLTSEISKDGSDSLLPFGDDDEKEDDAPGTTVLEPPLFQVKDKDVRHRNVRLIVELERLDPGSFSGYQLVSPDFRANVSAILLEFYDVANPDVDDLGALSRFKRMFVAAIRGDGWVRTSAHSAALVLDRIPAYRTLEDIVATVSVAPELFFCPHAALPSVPAFVVSRPFDLSFVIKSAFDNTLARHTSLASSAALYASFASGALLGSTAMLDVQITTLFPFATEICMNTGERRFGNNVWMLAPFGTPSMPQTALVLTNAAIFVGTPLLHLVAVVVFWFVRGKKLPYRAAVEIAQERDKRLKRIASLNGAPEPVDCVLFDPPPDYRSERWNDGVKMILGRKISAATVYFPSASIASNALLLLGTSFFSSRIFMNSSEGGAITTSLLGGTLCLGYTALVAYFSFWQCENCRFEKYEVLEAKFWARKPAKKDKKKSHGKSDKSVAEGSEKGSEPILQSTSLDEDCGPPEFDNETLAAHGDTDILQGLFFKKPLRKLLCFVFLPSGRWMPPLSRKMLACFLDPYRGGMGKTTALAWVVLPHAVTPTFVGFAFAVQPETMQGCIIQGAVIAVFCFLVSLAILLSRPYRTLFQNVLGACSMTLVGVMFVGYIIVAQHPDSFGREADDVLALALFMMVILSCVRVVYSFVLLVVEMRWIEVREAHLAHVRNPPLPSSSSDSESDRRGKAATARSDQGGGSDTSDSEGATGDRQAVSGGRRVRRERLLRPGDAAVTQQGPRYTDTTVYGRLHCSKENILSHFAQPLLLPPTVIGGSASPMRPTENPLHPLFLHAHGGVAFAFKHRSIVEQGSAGALKECGGAGDFDEREGAGSIRRRYQQSGADDGILDGSESTLSSLTISASDTEANHKSASLPTNRDQRGRRLSRAERLALRKACGERSAEAFKSFLPNDQTSSAVHDSPDATSRRLAAAASVAPFTTSPLYEHMAKKNLMQTARGSAPPPAPTPHIGSDDTNEPDASADITSIDQFHVLRMSPKERRRYFRHHRRAIELAHRERHEEMLRAVGPVDPNTIVEVGALARPERVEDSHSHIASGGEAGQPNQCRPGMTVEEFATAMRISVKAPEAAPQSHRVDVVSRELRHEGGNRRRRTQSEAGFATLQKLMSDVGKPFVQVPPPPPRQSHVDDSSTTDPFSSSSSDDGSDPRSVSLAVAPQPPPPPPPPPPPSTFDIYWETAL